MRQLPALPMNIALAAALTVAATGVAQSEPIAERPERPAKPNVLLIDVDDLRPDFAAYGGAEVESPNLDKLASEGLLFERVYAQFPLCMPSRSSVLSGYRPESINRTHRVASGASPPTPRCRLALP